jgi:glycosyltransferase involved in cell wall biosynthesis
MRVLAVTNLYPSAEAPASGVFIEQQIKGLIGIGLDIRVLFVNRRQEGPWTYYRLGPRLQREVAEFAPDLVHVMYGGVMADQVVRERNLPPVVVTFHGSDLLGENFSGLGRKLVSRYGVYCSRRAARRSQGVVVVARHLIKALGSGANPGKVRVIPCGIDLERFKARDPVACKKQLGWPANIAHVLFASANGDPVKRPELARAAVDGLARSGMQVQLHLLSGVRNDEVPTWISAADALVLTSHHEGSPTIVKEALACGLPVVSVDVGDVAEQIEGVDGCHLADADPADLALKLRWVCESQRRLDCPEKLRELSCTAVARKLGSFYEGVAGRRKAAQGQRELAIASHPS